MSTLIYSSETLGCGATIQLASGDFCIVSVAQSGVLVRSYSKGFLGRLLGSFFGPILFNEKNVYTCAQTAMTLSEQFPQKHPSLSFKNVVLSSFANAVWHCSSPAEVSVTLNQAKARSPSQLIVRC